MANKKKVPFNDLSGGINLRNSADRIDDNQFQSLINMSSEGNKLRSINGYSIDKDYAISKKIQGIKVFSNWQITICNNTLFMRNLDTNTVYTQAAIVSNLSDRYQIVVQKLVDISIIIINTNPATTEDLVAIEFNVTTHVFTTKSFTGLTDKNFKCGEFYEGKLLLGGNPAAPSILYYSKTFSALSLANIYDFSGYNGGSQPVGDGESIVAFATNNTEFFIFKKNSIFKVTGAIDTTATPSYVYTIKKETSTGAINAFSIANVDKDIIYFDGNTMRRISYETNIQALSDVAIGKDVEKIFLSLTQSQELNTFSIYSYPYVKLFLRSNISTANDFAVLYNTVDKSFSIQTGIDGNVASEGKVSNIRTCYIGSQFSSVIYKDNVGNNYNEGEISFSGLSKKMNMGDGVNYNQFFEFEIKGIIEIDLPVYVTILVDGSYYDKRKIDSSAGNDLAPTMGSALFGPTLIGANIATVNQTTTPFELKIPMYKLGREISYLVEGIGQGTFEISGTTVTFSRTKGYDVVGN